MLVLSRKINERLVLKHRTTGEVIVIDQREVRGGVSRIGVTASDDWSIVRAELLSDLDVNHPDFGLRTRLR